MQRKPILWLLLSVCLFIAAGVFWHLGDNQKAAYRAAHPTNAPVATPATTSAVSVVPTNAALAGHLVPSATNGYRLSNTLEPLRQLERNNHAVLLRNATIDTTKNVDFQIPEALKAKQDPGSYVVQSRQPLDSAFYALLSSAGAHFVSYIPNNAALVSASEAVAAQLKSNSDIQSVLPYEPYYKLDLSLLPLALANKTVPENSLLSVSAYPNGRDALKKKLSELGVEVLHEDRGPFGAYFVIKPTDLVALVNATEVQEVEKGGTRTAMNDLTRPILGVAANTTTNATYMGLKGSNVWININDTGVDASHPDLTTARVKAATFSPTWVLTDSNSYFGNNMGHGTHVAGIIAGDGTVSAGLSNVLGSIVPTITGQFAGEAPLAHLYVQSIYAGGPFDSDAYLQSSAALTNSLISSNKTLISNNSWNYNGMYGYETPAASFDAATRDAAPGMTNSQAVLFVFAAGNDGGGTDWGLEGSPDSILSPASGKNVIAVGALECNRNITNLVVTPTDDTGTNFSTNAIWLGETSSSTLVAPYSSRGNVGISLEGDYGRFKPDVVAPGTFVISTRPTAYGDPTIQYVEEAKYNFDESVRPHKTNTDYFVTVPADAIRLRIIVRPNGKSLSPFPDFGILADQTMPLTTVRDTNSLTIQNPDPGLWWYGVRSPIGLAQNASYDLVSLILRTNSNGDTFQVLSNLNSGVGPHYRYDTGTSMSAGAVSGILGLMQEALVKQGVQPSPALLKALLINGAYIPDRNYNYQVNREAANQAGWGLPNLARSIPTNMTATSGSVQCIDQNPTNALATGQSTTRLITVKDARAPMRITLVWTDPPGNPAASIKLVNDLDLIVTNLDTGEVYMGNDFGARGIYTTKGTNMGASDVINNVENVYMNASEELLGTNYSITVKATRVNVNAVTAHTNGIVQDYALVISSASSGTNSPFGFAAVATPIVTNEVAWLDVLTNGFPSLYQHVGANSPLLTYTNGATNQWHFYVFTNTVALTNVHATNVVFVTFMPPNLSIPRNTDADIDLYASTNSALTNLEAGVLNDRRTLRSVLRGGDELIYFTNSLPGQVYYVGVKSEDQQAAEYGLVGLATDKPLGTRNPDGSVDAQGFALPVEIPDDHFQVPGKAIVVAAIMDDGGLMTIRKVSVTNRLDHQFMGDLTADLRHQQTKVRLKGQISYGTDYSQEVVYDDSNDNTIPGSVRSRGPGSLLDYVGESAVGSWILRVNDNAMVHTGSVQALDIHIDPKPLDDGFDIALLPNTWFYNYVDIPTDGTNLSITITYRTNSSSPVDVHLNPGDYPPPGVVTNVFNNPGGILNWSIYNDPPLSDGRWFYGIYNEGPDTVYLHVRVHVDRRMVPDWTVTFQSTNTPGKIFADMVNTNAIWVPFNERVFSTQVGIRILDPRAADLALSLSSPNGTRVLLFENRGRTNAEGLGLTVTNSSGEAKPIYAVFTENTNYTTTLIKFAVPPYGSTNEVVTSIIPVFTNTFDTNLTGIYTNGQTVDGWTLLLTNVWSTNLVYSNNMVSVVSDLLVPADSGTNFLALGNGHVVRTNAVNPGHPYRLSYAYRGPGIVSWWSGNGTTKDLIGTNDGTFSLGTLINVDFGGTAGKVGLAATGQTTNDYWNALRSSGGTATLSNMRDASGTPTRVGLSLSNVAGYYLLPPEVYPDPGQVADTMFSTYQFANHSTLPLTVTNLPAGQYDFYLYGHGLWQGECGVFLLSSAGNGYGTKSTTTNDPSWTSSQWKEGAQYVVFRNVLVLSNVPVQILVSNVDHLNYNDMTIGNTADINGMQIVKCPQNYAAGKVDSAFNFDGTNYVKAPASSSLDVGKVGGFSVEFWVKPVVKPINQFTHDAFFEWNDGQGNIGTHFETIDEGYVPPLMLTLNVVDTSLVSHIIEAPADFSDPITFEHVAATYNKASGMAYVYHNGKIIASSNLGSFTPQTSYDLYFGSRPSGAFSDFYTGRTDEVGLYNRALSPAEISGIYHAGSTGKFSANSPMPSSQVTIDGMTSVVIGNSTNWMTNSFVFTPTNTTTIVELDGNPLGMLFDSFKLEELPSADYGNYYLPEESLDIFKGERALGYWTLQAWDTRTWQPTNANLISWDLQLMFSSTNVQLIVLTNGLYYAGVVDPGTNLFFAFDVPADASYTTNSLTNTTAGVLSGLNLWFNQTDLPTGDLPGDAEILHNVTNSQSVTLGRFSSLPGILPGKRYFLDLYNPSTTNQSFSIRIDSDVSTNVSATALADSLPLSVTNTGTQYYYYDVGTNATAVMFEVLQPTNDVDLYVQKGLPLPGKLNFDYVSERGSTVSESVLVLTNSQPTPLSAGRWYMAVTATNGQPVVYTVLAKEFTGTNLLSQLTNSVPSTNTVPGANLSQFVAPLLAQASVSKLSSNTIQYFLVDVPAQAAYATNFLTNTIGSNGLSLLFNQTLLPTGSQSSDFTLLTNVVAGTNVLSLTSFPTLQPGLSYLLGVLNTNSTEQKFVLQVSFGLATNIPIVNLTNTLSYSAKVLTTNGLQYFGFDVPENSGWVAYEILNATNAIGLGVRHELPLPDFANDDYTITNSVSSNPQQAIVVTNPPAGRWYLSVTNASGVSGATYKIRATAWASQNGVTILTNRVTSSNTVSPNTIRYFAVDVPRNVSSVNHLLSGTNTLSLFFNQRYMPLGTLPGDFVILTNVTTANHTLLTNANTTPVLQAGQRYYLGVANTNSFTSSFSLEVEFGYTIVALTNGVAYTNQIPATLLPQYYSYTITNPAQRVTFEVLNPSGDVSLLAQRQAPPEVSGISFFSNAPWTNNEFILLTNSTALTLTNGTWYLTVTNLAATAPINYSVRASDWDLPTHLNLPGTLFIEGNSYQYFDITVPLNALAATNSLICSNHLDLWYSAVGLPTGTLPGDYPFVNNPTVLFTNSVPPLSPGNHYYLGVHNTNSIGTNFTLSVGFDYLEIPLENGVIYTNYLLNDFQKYSYNLSSNAVSLAFEVLSFGGGTLSAQHDGKNYSAQSNNVAGGFVYEFILVTNLADLTPGKWLVGVAQNNSSFPYFIRATEYNANGFFALGNGIAHADSVASGGQQFYSFNVSSNATKVFFDLLNAEDTLNLVIRHTLPLPDTFNADYISYGSGVDDEQIVVTKSSSPVPLTPGLWWIGVSSTPLSAFANYEIRATEVTNSPVVITLTNGILYTNAIAARGFANATNLDTVYYQIIITNNPPVAVFALANLTGDAGLVFKTNTVIVTNDFPTPWNNDLSMLPPTNSLTVQTNALRASLNGTWTLAVTNGTLGNIGFDIAATLLTTNAVVGTNGSIFQFLQPFQTANGLHYGWDPIPGLSYQVEVSTNLPVFLPLTNFTATSTNSVFFDFSTTNGIPYQFYRIHP